MNRLTDLITNGLAKWQVDLRAPVPANLMRMFRFFFMTHVFLFTLKFSWTPMTSWKMHACRAVMLACIFLALHRKLYPIAMLVALALQLYLVALSFPITGNHKYVEAYILFLLLVCPDRPSHPRTPDVATNLQRDADQLSDGTCARLIGSLILSIYVYGGLQKLVNGRWHSGEYLTYTLLHPREYGLPVTLRGAIGMVADVVGLPSVDSSVRFATAVEHVPLHLPLWITVLLIGISWFTILGEISVPLLAVNRRTRAIGLRLCLVMSVFIGLVSWETEFMFAAVGCLLLFYPHPVRNYAVLTAIHVVWSLCVHITDTRIWFL